MFDTARWDPCKILSTYFGFCEFEFQDPPKIYKDFISALSKLLVSLEESRGNLPTGCDEELGFLSDLLQSRELHALVKVHNSIVEKDDRFTPVISNGIEILEDVLDELAPVAGEENPECLDLFELLQTPHLQGLLYCHDIIAQKDYLPKLPDLQPEDMPDPNEPEETIKIVQLVKSTEPLVSSLF
jgi:hypothetical protein